MSKEMNMDFSTDLDFDMVKHAYSWSSMNPNGRATQTISDYCQILAVDYEGLNEKAKENGTTDLLEVEFPQHRERYKKHFIAWLNAMSRTASSMVTGRSNFPTASNQKRLSVEQKCLVELTEYRDKALNSISKKLRPSDRPIMAGDSDAVQRLEAKLNTLVKRQDMMKAVNKLIRRHKKSEDKGKSAIVELTGFSGSLVDEILKPDRFGSVGFPSYEITNNGAAVRNTKKRLESLKKAESTPDEEVEINGIAIEICHSDNRVRICFNGGPSDDVKADLRSSGFRWTPSLGCWQAYVNNRSIYNAKRIAELL